MTVVIDGTSGITSPAESVSGNLTFTGTGNRITGDFSNATIANRVMFQSSTTNGATEITAIPNGTSVNGNVAALNNTDPTNAGRIRIGLTDTISYLDSGRLGTGTYLPMTFYTGGSERVRVDTSGNVGIGTSSPTAVFTNYKSLYLNGSSGSAIQMQSNGSLASNIVADTNALYLQNITAITFNTGGTGTGTERARIDSSGNLLVGTTSTGSEIGRLTVKQAFDGDGGGLRLIAPNSSNVWAVRTGSDNALYFGYNGTSKANINSTSGGYTALSDARLKENVQESVKGLSEILALRSVSYTFIDDEAKTEQIGFIAQEVEPVIPEVVSTPNSSSQYYGLNYAGVVPVLVKAIQEQQTLITALTARITALEAQIV